MQEDDVSCEFSHSSTRKASVYGSMESRWINTVLPQTKTGEETSVRKFASKAKDESLKTH